MPRSGGFRTICDADLDDRTLRIDLLDELALRVPFDAHVWLLTDPETEVGASPVAAVPRLEHLPEIVRAKYLTTVGRWTTLGAGEVTSAARATSDDRAASPIWAAAARTGIADIASTVFRDPFGCWGFLDLWRSDSPFTDDELSVVAELSRVATGSLRRSLERTFTLPSSGVAARHAPAVLLLTEELGVLTQTPQAEADLRAVLPTAPDRAPVPASALNVGAQRLASEAGVDDHPASACVHLGGGVWGRVGAARLDRTDGLAAAAAIAVSIDRLAPHARAELYARVIGLTEREAEVLAELVRGGDTRAVADRLFVSPHTVQDHLKSIFTKAGVRNRPALVARATGAAGDDGG